jgi:NTE family protein
MEQRVGLILTGGGARAAYQVGVLKAISEALPRQAHNPFSIICGTSAGSLNAAVLAVNAQNFRIGVRYLSNIWKSFHANQIYRTDVVGVFNNSLLWFAGLLLSAFGVKKFQHVSLLDNSPLVDLLEEILPCEKIQENIDAGLVHALSITASGYGSGQSVTFYQGVPHLEPWRRARRIGVSTRIEIKHLLASAAIPFIFPAVRIHREYFGDGSMRQIAPISSALHLGATRVLVIAVNHIDVQRRANPNEQDDYPPLAQIAGHALNSLFLDNMEVDLERVRRINVLVEAMPQTLQDQLNLKHVEVFSISPSQSVEAIAQQYAGELPWTIKLLLRLVGATNRGGATLMSYLLSERKFCNALIELGYQDALSRRAEILEFLGASPAYQNDMPQ